MCRYSVSADPIQTVETRYNIRRTMCPVILDTSNPQLGLSDIVISVDGAFLTCKFRRQKAQPVEGYHDLNSNWYVLGAQGMLNTTSNGKKWTFMKNTLRNLYLHYFFSLIFL
jgi:hypothetical protein